MPKDTTYSSYSVFLHRIYGCFTQKDHTIETKPADQEVHQMEVTSLTEWRRQLQAFTMLKSVLLTGRQTMSS